MDNEKPWPWPGAAVILATLLMLVSLVPVCLVCARRGRRRAADNDKQRSKRRTRVRHRDRSRTMSSDCVPDTPPRFSDEREERPQAHSAEGTVPTVSTPPHQKKSDETSPFTPGADYDDKPYVPSEGEKAVRYRKRRKHTGHTPPKAPDDTSEHEVSVPIPHSSSEAKHWARLSDINAALRAEDEAGAPAPLAPAAPTEATDKARSPIFQRIPSEFWSVQQQGAKQPAARAHVAALRRTGKQEPVRFWRCKPVSPPARCMCAQRATPFAVMPQPLAPPAQAKPPVAGTEAAASSDGGKAAFWKRPPQQAHAGHQAAVLAVTALAPPPPPHAQPRVDAAPAATAAPAAGGRTAALQFWRQTQSQRASQHDARPIAATHATVAATPVGIHREAGGEPSHSPNYSALGEVDGSPSHRRLPIEHRSWLT